MISVCNPIHSTILKLALGYSLAFLLLLPASAQLSPEAQKAYEQGMAAAQQQSWDQAIAGFAAAQKLAEREPSVLYNLGLAHDKAGHDLAAEAWFRTYLAVSPKAPDATAVQSEIAKLQESNTNTIKMIFAASLTAARQIPWEDLRWKRLADIAIYQAGAGQIEEALVTEQEAYTLSLNIPANRPDVPGRPHIEIMDRSNVQSRIWRSYIDYLITLHNVPKAQETLSSITDPGQIPSAQMDIAKGLAFKYRYEEAEKLLPEVEQEISRLPSPADQLDCLLDLADAYTVIHKPDIARKVLDSAKALDQKIDAHIYDWVYKQRLDRITAAEKGDFPEADERSYSDAEIEMVGLAEQLSAQDEVVRLETKLEQAKHPDPNIPSKSEADSIAQQLAEIADTLGHSTAVVDSLDAVDFQWGRQRSMNILALHLNLAIYATIGAGTASNPVGIDDFRALLAKKGKVWEESDKGKVVVGAIRAADNSYLLDNMKYIEDEKGWAIELVFGANMETVYIAKARTADLYDLENFKDEIGVEFADWLLTDPRSPMSAPYKAAVEAARGEEIP